jgi:hypothetical protein
MTVTESAADSRACSAPAAEAGDGTRLVRERLGGRVLLAAACLSAAVWCIPMFQAHPLALDEHGSFWIIDPAIPASVWQRCQSYAATPPLPSWLQQLSLMLCGQSEWALRLPFAIAFVAAVMVTYRIGCELQAPGTGGLAALLLAWHPLVLDEVRIGRGYGLVLLLTSLLVLETLRWMRSVPSWRRLLAWSITGSLLVWTHYLTAPLVALVGCGLFRSRAGGPADPPRWRLSPWPWMAAGLVGLLCLPLGPAVYRLWLWSAALSGPASDVPLAPLVGSFWWLGFPVGFGLSRIVSTVAGGSAEGGPPRGHELAFLTVLVVAPILGLYLMGQMGMSGLATPRYRVGFTVPAVLLCATLMARRQAFCAACVGGLAVIAAVWWSQGRTPWKPTSLGNPMDAAWRDMALVIRERGRPGEPIFVQNGLLESHLVPAYYHDPLFHSYTAMSMSHFYLPVDSPRYALPWLWQQPTAMSQWYLERLAVPPGEGVWLAAALDTDLNRLSVEGFLALVQQAGLRVVERREFYQAILLRLER